MVEVDGLCMCGCGQKTPIARWTDKRRGAVKGQPLRYLPSHNRYRGTAAKVCRLEECDKPTAKRSSLCPMHLARYRRHGDVNARTRLPFDMPLDERIRHCSEVNPETGCWEWQWSLTNGYGQMQIGRKSNIAHRISYETFVGPIPEGLVLDHLCRNTKCVNPEHLEPVTAAENSRRGYAPTIVLWRENRCKRGHEFTPENTYRAPKTGHRQCVTCRRLRSKKAAA